MRAVLLLLFLPLAGCVAPEATIPSESNFEAELDFSWDPLEPKAGEPVTLRPSYSLLATDRPREWQWDLGDGTVSDSAAIAHRFEAGIFEVSLQMVSEQGITLQASHVIGVAPAKSTSSPSPDPAQPSEPSKPRILAQGDGLTFQFTYEWDRSPEAVGWDFGDGTTAKQVAPTHTYHRPGTYTVRVSLLAEDVLATATLDVDVTSDAPFFLLSDVGRNGPEPSVGITSDKCIFFAAMESVMRSCDYGTTWDRTNSITTSPVSFDPYLWVDRDTDRIFDIQMIHLACTWIAWSDDGGRSWTGNPFDCGTLPLNDHIKLATGPWTDEALAQNPVYPNAVYFCYNKLVGVYCATSFDGGATFAYTRPACNGGLHGAIETAVDGTVYVPPRSGNPHVCLSRDNGLTWVTRSVDARFPHPDPHKNPEVATDRASNAYYTWIDTDHRVRLSTSPDGNAWTSSVVVSPAAVTSSTFVHAVAGDPGRVAVTYLGSENTNANPHHAPIDARYDLYVSISLNALDEVPVWTTVKITEDPVQIGSICLNSGDCRDGNRNLLDFNDMHIGPDGRIHIAFADGCTGGCATKDDPKPSDSRDAQGMVAILARGPSLYEDVELEPLI